MSDKYRTCRKFPKKKVRKSSEKIRQLMGTSTVIYSYLKQGVDNWMVHGIHHDAPRFRRALSDVSKKKLHFFTVGNDEVAFPQISCPRIFMLFIDIGPRAKPWQRLAIKQISKNLILVSLFRNKKQEN